MTLELIENCSCEQECPSCIHFPTCGAGNAPLDKVGGIHLLKVLTRCAHIDLRSLPSTVLDDEPLSFAIWEDDKEADSRR